MIGSFGSKLTFTIGTTYMFSGLVGFFAGAIFIKKPLLNFPSKRMLYSYYFNNMMQKGLSFANNSGGAAFLYCINGWVISRWFEEELDFLDNLGKNTLAGGVTGALYKSTRGIKASVVGALLGITLISTFTVVTDYLNDRDIIDFQMNFDS